MSFSCPLVHVLIHMRNRVLYGRNENENIKDFYSWGSDTDHLEDHMCGWTLPEAKYKSNNRNLEREVTRKKGDRHDQLDAVITLRVRGECWFQVAAWKCMPVYLFILEMWAHWGEKRHVHAQNKLPYWIFDTLRLKWPCFGALLIFDHIKGESFPFLTSHSPVSPPTHIPLSCYGTMKWEHWYSGKINKKFCCKSPLKYKIPYCIQLKLHLFKYVSSCYYVPMTMFKNTSVGYSLFSSYVSAKAFSETKDTCRATVK